MPLSVRAREFSIPNGQWLLQSEWRSAIAVHSGGLARHRRRDVGCQLADFGTIHVHLRILTHSVVLAHRQRCQRARLVAAEHAASQLFSNHELSDFGGCNAALNSWTPE